MIADFWATRATSGGNLKFTVSELFIPISTSSSSTMSKKIALKRIFTFINKFQRTIGTAVAQVKLSNELASFWGIVTKSRLVFTFSPTRPDRHREGSCPQRPINFLRDARTKNNGAYLLCPWAAPPQTARTPIPPKYQGRCGQRPRKWCHTNLDLVFSPKQ